MFQLVTEPQFGKSVRRYTEIKSASGIVLPERRNPVVVEVEVERLRSCEQSRRRKKMTEPIQRMVVLRRRSVARTDDEIVAKLRSKPTDIMECHPRAHRKPYIGVIRAVDDEQRIHCGRRIVFLVRSDQ